MENPSVDVWGVIHEQVRESERAYNKTSDRSGGMRERDSGLVHTWIKCDLQSSTSAVQSTFANLILPSYSGYFSCTSLVAASQVGSSLWHQWHQGA